LTHAFRSQESNAVAAGLASLAVFPGALLLSDAFEKFHVQPFRISCKFEFSTERMRT
jgi:hypothetical protein